MVSGPSEGVRIKGTKNSFKEDMVNRYMTFRRGLLPGNIPIRAKGQEANMASARQPGSRPGCYRRRQRGGWVMEA